MNIDRKIRAASVMGLAFAASVSSSAFAAGKPPLAVDSSPPATAVSSISATLQFSLPTLDRALERKVPRRLATIDDDGRSCWHRRILGRMVNIDCEYSGYVERTGPISLRAENGRMEAAMPLFGTVSGEGIGRFARMLHGTGEGQLMVYATARPRLKSDWSVSLDMREGFRWREPPTLQILGFRIDLTRYIEPKIRQQIGRIQSDAAASVAAMNIRGKAESAWQQAFAVVKIVDSPAVWLKTTPQAIAFSGTRARGDVLEGSIEISGATETAIGTQPSASAPTQLPTLGSDVTNPGRFSVIIPVTISYDQIRQKIQDVMSARAQSGGPDVQDISVYPSSGKIVAGLHLKIGSDSGDGAWVYVTATPQVDAAAQTVQFGDFSITTDSTSAPGNPLATLLNDPTLLQNLQQQMRLTFQTEWQAMLASASTRLTRPLANGFRSEGSLTSAELSNVSLLPDALRIDLLASGNMKILYGM
ncbi:DUF4403 family protein [soil metagenome]